MRSVQFGWDRMQVAEAASLHREVLTEILFGLQVRSAEDVPWHREQFAAAMPVFNPQAAIEYRDPFMGVFELIAANVDQIVDSYAGTLTRTRPTNNKLDRLIGRLGELWFQAEGEQPKAGSKEHQRPWPFERFVFAIWEEAEGERQADTKNRPPSRRLIKAALERWNAISSAA